MKDIIVNERYRIDRRIGEGAFGFAYAGTDLESNKEVALKLVRQPDEFRLLSTEADICKELDGGTGFARFFWYGEDGEYLVLVQEYLGPSLEDLLAYCGGHFSLKTTLLIADQALAQLEYMHNRGIVHRDVKPEHFLLGLGRQGSTLYLVDFGLVRESNVSVWNHQHEPRTNQDFIGTRDYASLNAHSGLEQSRRDDLECLGYVLLRCLLGELPWESLQAGPQQDDNEVMKAAKSRKMIETLCGGVPAEFGTYMAYVRTLTFKERPDYSYLRFLFSRLFLSRKFEHDDVFDWTEKRFQELQECRCDGC